jgi:hypothetical protein
MTFAFGAFTLGAALLISAFKDQSLVSLVLGQPGKSIEGQGHSDPSIQPSVANASGAVNAGGVALGGSVKGHPELKPGIAGVVSAVLKQFPGLKITSTTGGVHAAGSLHYLGRAADLAGSAQLMAHAVAWIKSSGTGALLTEGIHNPGLSIKNQKNVPASFWGSVTWAAHKNHIHLAV